MAHYISSRGDGVFDRVHRSVASGKEQPGWVSVNTRAPALPCFADGTPLTEEEVSTWRAGLRQAAMVQGITQGIVSLSLEMKTAMLGTGLSTVPMNRGQARKAIREATKGKTLEEQVQILKASAELSDQRTELGEIGGTWEQVLWVLAHEMDYV